jgi:hypothetical protein
VVTDRTWRVVIGPTVVAAMDRDLAEDVGLERGGVIVGRLDRDAATVRLTGSVPARGARADAARLTFTHEAWAHVGRVMDEHFPHDRVVGWYHSHPALGVFLSAQDRFVHTHFFARPWQVAYVHDPVAGGRGLFGWVAGALVERRLPRSLGG